jgi:hypothetical protein
LDAPRFALRLVDVADGLDGLDVLDGAVRL